MAGSSSLPWDVTHDTVVYTDKSVHHARHLHVQMQESTVTANRAPEKVPEVQKSGDISGGEGGTPESHG